MAVAYARRPAASIDPDAARADNSRRYMLVPVLPDTHACAGFGHFDEYSSMYYTYEWDKVIAIRNFLGRPQDVRGVADWTSEAFVRPLLPPHSHSMVAGGLPLMS